MKVSRISTETLAVFKTFDRYKNPPFLEIQSKEGDLSMLDELPTLGFGVVGSRYPQRKSVELLENSIKELRRSRLIIISGFARGIDSYAHEFAVQSGLRTIALLGCGLDIDYPKENADLRHKIINSGGLVISAFGREEQPLPKNFHHRNGLIAGFSNAVWVVEAAEVSGTLNTANWAMKMNRNLYATSCFPTDPFYQGNVKLLSQKRSDRYPVAEAYFGTESLNSTWSYIGVKDHSAQRSFEISKKAQTKIQKWILLIQSECGECQIQNLMNYAASQGHTLGKFYLEYEKELEMGYIKQDSQGRVDALL